MKVRKADIAPLLAKTFPGYKGRTYRVEPTESVRFYNLNWCGGSRNFYRAVGMLSGEAATLQPHAPWDEPREGIKVDLPPNLVVVRHTYFCGKDLGITFYCHPTMLPRLLPHVS